MGIMTIAESPIARLQWTLVARGFSPNPPSGPQDKMHNHPTLLFSWFCTICAVVLIVMRLMGRLTRSRKLFPEDKVMAWSMVPLLARMALVHLVMLWGTNNVNLANALSAADIRHRRVGSRLVLASRICYAMFIWMAKFTVSEFLKRLTASYWKTSYQITLHFIRIFLLVSFIAVVIAILAECQPFDHYWQVVPDPGPQCRQAYAQLWTMAVADVITDILLVVFPLTILLPASGMPLIRRLRISVLFALSAVNIVITAWRVDSVVRDHGSQQRRTVFASSEILAAAAVSNAVIIASFLRDRGVRHTTWHNTVTSDHTRSMTGSAIRSPTTPNMSILSPTTSVTMSSRRPTLLTRLTEAGDSDEDLFSGMCYRPAVSDTESDPLDASGHPAIPRPAQAISRAELSRHTSAATPHEDSDMSDHFPPESSNIASMRPLVKTVTFSDPGGLLAKAPSRASTIAGNDDETEDADLDADEISHAPGRRRWRSIGSDTSTRAGTPAELQDVGGLLDGHISGGRVSGDMAFTPYARNGKGPVY